MYKICKTAKSLARQRELENGFLDYMETTAFADIETAELCRFLNIPRKTFYRYFGSKEDALYALIDHRLADMDDLREEYFSDTPHTLQLEAILFFSYWKEQARFLDILERNFLTGFIVVRSILQSRITVELSAAQNQDTKTDSRTDYLISFMVTGMMSMLIRWHNSGFQKSVEELADITEMLFSQPLAETLDLDI